MKLLLTTCYITITQICFCQKLHSGAYMSLTDYYNKTTTLNIKCLKNSNKKLFYRFFTDKSLKLNNGNKIVKKQKKDIFGYRDCNNFDYRFQNNLHYKIREVKGMVIYSINYRLSTNFGKFKFPVAERYYFSKSLNDKIIPLTRENLFREYENRKEFLNAVDNYLKKLSCIHCYDLIGAGYIVNLLFEDPGRKLDLN